MKRVARSTIALLLIGMWVNVACASLGGAPALSIGQTAPEFNLASLKNGAAGDKLALSSLRGHPVIVNFWATWCGPCRAEFPAFQSQYEKNKDTNGLVIVAIEAQQDEGLDAAQKFVSEMKATFPILIDTDGGAEQAYQVRGLPTTVFIDRKGIVKDINLGGPLTEDVLQTKIAEIIQN